MASLKSTEPAARTIEIAPGQIVGVGERVTYTGHMRAWRGVDLTVKAIDPQGTLALVRDDGGMIGQIRPQSVRLSA